MGKTAAVEEEEGGEDEEGRERLCGTATSGGVGKSTLVLSGGEVYADGATKEGDTILANGSISGGGVDELDETAALELTFLLDPTDLLDLTA